MTATTPRISVVLAAYNAVKHVEAAVRSVLSQSYRDFELIVLDDASSDGTADRVEQIGDDRLIVVRGQKNAGQTELLNLGIAQARGEYIARMDADDLCESSRFAVQVAYLDRYPNVSLVASNAILIDDAGAPHGRTTTLPSAGLLLWEMAWRCPIMHPSVMFRRDFVQKLGGFDPQFLAQDYDLWIRIIHAGGKIAVLPEFLIQYRTSPGQQTSVFRQRFIDDTCLIAHRHVEWLLTGQLDVSLVRGLISLYRGENLVDDPRQPDYLRLAAQIVSACAERMPSDQALIRDCAADALVFAAAEAQTNGGRSQAFRNMVQALRSRPVRTLRPSALRLLANIILSKHRYQ